MEENQPLDDKYQYNSITKDSPTIPIILKYGIIGSMILVFVSILQYTIVGAILDNDTASTYIIFALSICISYVVYIVVMTLSLIEYKKTNSGLASLVKGIEVTFLTGLFMAVISIVFSAIMTSIFGIGYLEMGNESGMLNDYNSTSYYLILISSVFSLIYGSIAGILVALIISLVLRKERPKGIVIY